MTYNFCTLFDSYYLTRGMALYESLINNCNTFHLYIFAFDTKTFDILKSKNLNSATIISLSDFEDDALLEAKRGRTVAEYCWTCTASTITYAIQKYNLDHCTYVDADIYFFSSPAPIFEEIGDSSVAITPHNFSKELRSSEIYGKYCVQFTYFKNDKDGLAALNWWRESCLNWCFAKLQDGKYGDQKYLDYFEKMFKGVHIVTNIGSGLAPWNISDYQIKFDDTVVLFKKNDPALKSSPLIFFHYQGLKFFQKGDLIVSDPAVISVASEGLNLIYKPYIQNLLSVQRNIEGKPKLDLKIRFRRTFFKKILFFVRMRLKRFWFVRVIYYLITNRYGRPRGIGSEIK